MQPVSSAWKQIFGQSGHLTEVKVSVAGVTYGIDRIYTATQRKDIFNQTDPTIGCCCASNLSFEIIPNSPVPRMAEAELFTRLVSSDGTELSEWIPSGLYFVDTRSKERDGMSMTFTAYDSMLKADFPYLENSAIATWPADEADVVDDIADLMGVTVDSRTVLAGYEVPIPQQDWTAREVLGWIAAANGGNWIITPNNELLLIKLSGETSLLSKNHSTAILFGDSLIVLSTGTPYEDIESSDGNIQKNARNMQNLGLLQPFTGVKLWYDRETTYEDREVEVGGETTTEKVEVENAYFSGDDSGRVLEADCPWATQAMADAILAQIEGYCWQGAVVEGAEITPAAELGDFVICDGVSFPLCSMDITYDGAFAPTISAPADEEVDYEYHYESETQRQLNRKATLGENYYGFKVTRENGIEVVNIVDGVETTRMILNSSIQAFYNSNGEEALYFDAEAGKYKFVGDVTVLSGSLNINNNFIVDTDGNVVCNGDVLLQGSNTRIDAPNIYGGKYYNSGGNAYLEIGSDLSFWASHTIGTPLFKVFDGTTSADLQFYGSSVMRYNDVASMAYALGAWRYLGSGYTGADAEIATVGKVQDMIDAALGS